MGEKLSITCSFLLLLLLSACSSHDLYDGREAFYQGDYAVAEEEIGTEDVSGTDTVLVLMERGTIRQAEGRYQDSSADFILANDILEELETYSISEGASSMVVNDTVQSYQGVPFERTLLHALTAMNHLALNNWNDAGVEARRIILSLTKEKRGEEYPDDAFSRYIAGFILQYSNDEANAVVQYQRVDTMMPELTIGSDGSINQNDTVPVAGAEKKTELICFFMLGQSPVGRYIRRAYNGDSPPRVSIYARGEHLGNGVILTDVNSLAQKSWQLGAAARAVKTAARIAAKEVFARSMEEQDALLGALTRIVLIGMLERPDFRRWETLPHWLGVARVTCPAEMDTFELHIETGGPDVTPEIITVTRPVVKRGDIYFSFVRDLPGFNNKFYTRPVKKIETPSAPAAIKKPVTPEVPVTPENNTMIFLP